MKSYNLALCISLFFTVTLSAQQLPEVMEIDSVSLYFNRQLQIYPQEKIYAQIDKPVYISGEDIWFRAYIINAAWHMPDTTSRYVYAELINPQNEIENRVKVRVENGAYQGYIPLNEKLPEGDYKLRFYTRYLEGLGKEYFFERTIQIGTLAKLAPPTENTRERKRTTVKPLDYKVDFFPEGGALPDGAVSRIAFKALNEKGLGEEITGHILNEKGDTLQDITSNRVGMGSFLSLVKNEVPLWFVCTNKAGIEKRLPFPKVDMEKFALKTSTYKERLYITITRPVEQNLPETLSLLGFSQGIPFYAKKWDTSKEMVLFDEKALPQGVIQFLLVDNYGNPLSERVYFNHRNPYPVDINYSTHKPQYKAREKVENNLSLTDTEGQPLTGSFSVAITDDRDVLPDSCVNILSALLLTSELKGYIEDPGYYFRNINTQKIQELDNLMLTQGWSRYEVKNILKGNLQTPPVPKEIGMEITGQVKGGIFLNRTGEGYPVTLLSMSPFFYEETMTDENGNFRFAYFECPDSMNYVIQGRNRKGGNRAEILYNDDKFPKLSPFIPVGENQKDTLTLKQYLQKADNQLLLTKGIRTVHLSDIVVTAEKKTSVGQSTFSSSFNDRYDQDYIDKQNPTTIFNLLGQLPGVTVSGEKVYITRNLATGGEALIMIDDVTIENDLLGSLTVMDVAEVEVVKGAGAAMFGSRGGNGAILITTKRGEFNSGPTELFHIKTITPLGFQITKQFYSPSYETEKKEDFINPDLRTTIYWNPNIKIGEEGKTTFEFYTAEQFTTYSVVIEGITTDGRIIHLTEKIEGNLK